MNLLNNAIEALEEKLKTAASGFVPQIQITTRLSRSIPSATQPHGAPQIEIHIMDNGIGIPTQLQTHLFEPFFTTKPLEKGTGLGLAISYSIVVEQHHGLLTCCSQPETGTDFVIQLPLA